MHHFKARLATMVAVLLIAIAGVLAPAPAAHAGVLCDAGISCGTIGHTTDAGYDASIIIICNYGDAFPNVDWSKLRYVREGQMSTRYCKDTDVVFVRKDEEIWCRSGTSKWEKRWDAYGPHKITDLVVEKHCVLKRD